MPGIVVKRKLPDGSIKEYRYPHVQRVLFNLQPVQLELVFKAWNLVSNKPEYNQGVFEKRELKSISAFAKAVLIKYSEGLVKLERERYSNAKN